MAKKDIAWNGRMTTLFSSRRDGWDGVQRGCKGLDFFPLCQNITRNDRNDVYPFYHISNYNLSLFFSQLSEI